jgi:hypothetical protein
MTSIKVSHWRELQGLIAFKILEYYYKKGDSQQKKVLQKGFADIFHGVGQGEPVSYGWLQFGNTSGRKNAFW